MVWERAAKGPVDRPRQVGNSDIWLLPTPNPSSIRIRIPVPPSCNARQKPVYRGGRRPGLRLKLTDEALGYFQNALPLRLAWKRVMARPVEDYVKMRFGFFLANMAYDTHNGLKLACDMIQKSGLVLNDRFILPQVEVPVPAPVDPRLVIEFPLPSPPAI